MQFIVVRGRISDVVGKKRFLPIKYYFVIFCSKYIANIGSQEVNTLPNIKSAIKRVKVSETKTLKNTIRKSALKTSIKKCKEAIAKTEDTASEAYKSATKALDKAASKNILHKNTAARRKSRLAKALNAVASK